MIIRMWHGRVPAAKKQQYLDYLIRTGLKDATAISGNRGVELLARDMGQLTEFVTLTRWDSVEAIKAFAGADFQKARYYPDDAQYLSEMEPFVKHYEVLHSQPPA
jgi:heme-degrading monooxygenase HmoA